jgi:alkyl sulfatase BDS1-like metallo-beta-lactamase superfamily hydrolase
MFDPGAAEGFEATYELRMGEDRFRAEVSGDSFKVERGGVERPDATIEADSATLAELVYQGRALAEALRSGDVKIAGDEAAVERLLTLFPLPEPAALV